MQIETVVKSCPLTPLSANVNDLQPLTPGHFFVGGLLLNVSENNAIIDSLLFSSRWTVVKRLKMLFLALLDPRIFKSIASKQQNGKNPWKTFKIRQLVLLKEKNDKFIDRKLTRITKTYKGEDRHICAIDLKTSTGMLCICRNITRVVHLHFYDEFGQPSNNGQDVQANSENS